MILFVLGADAERQQNVVSTCPMEMNFLFLKTEDPVVLEATAKAMPFDIVIIDTSTTMDYTVIRSTLDSLDTRVIVATLGNNSASAPYVALGADMYLVFPLDQREVVAFCQRLMREPIQRSRAMTANQKASVNGMSQ